MTPESRAGRARLANEALRLARSLVVGSGGTLLDLAVVLVAVRVVNLEATWARALGLCAGCVFMFYGSRSFAFRAESDSAVRQAKRFVLSEAIGFPLNIMLFRALLVALPTAAPEALSVAANFALFLVYYYPVRNFVVFRACPAT